VISEVAFCHRYSSFWRVAAPTTDLLVRRINSGFYQRDFAPMESDTDPASRAILNEVAFTLFCRDILAKHRWLRRDLSSAEITEAITAVIVAGARAEGAGSGGQIDLTREEVADVREQHMRLVQTFVPYAARGELLITPAFAGCGIVDSCKGDVLVADVLYEIKAGDRLFRSADVRQLLTYAALNHVRKLYEINSVALFNPRVGVRCEFELSELCFEASGKDAVALLSQIAEALSSGEMSA